jgi:hypothetical protein
VLLGLTVTGISQTTDIKGLEKALVDAGFPLDPIQLVTPDDSDKNLTDVESQQRIDTNLMLGGGQGTGVPGISGGHSEYEIPHGSSYFRSEELWDRLDDFEIPDDEIENYLEALSAGRSVVAYFAGKQDNVPKLETLFRSSGLSKVKTF